MKQSEHFDSLRNEVDIRRETLLLQKHDEKNHNEKEEEELHKESGHMIEQIELVEEHFRVAFARLKPHLTCVDINEEKRSVEEFFRTAHLTVEDILARKRDVDAKYQAMRRYLTYFKYLECELEKNRLVITANHEVNSKLIGG